MPSSQLEFKKYQQYYLFVREVPLTILQNYGQSWNYYNPNNPHTTA